MSNTPSARSAGTAWYGAATGRYARWAVDWPYGWPQPTRCWPAPALMNRQSCCRAMPGNSGACDGWGNRTGARSGAFDQHDLAVGNGLADRFRRLVFGRVVAVPRGGQRFELDDDVAGPALPFLDVMRPAARQKFRAEAFESRLGRRDIIPVALRIAYIDAGDPVSLGHAFPPIIAQKIRRRASPRQ